MIAKAALIILCVPATSVPSERVFSTAWDIVTAQRASPSPDNVDALMFLKKNMYVQIWRETKSDEQLSLNYSLQKKTPYLFI